MTAQVQIGVSLRDAVHGGFADDSAYHPVTQAAYCRRLVRYIADDSTVRARCTDYFGTAPSIEAIAAIRAAPRAGEEIAGRQREVEPLGNALHWQVRPMPGVVRELEREQALRARRKALNAAAPLPVPAVSDAAWSWQALVALVAADFGLTARQVMSPSRRRDVVRVRQLIYALMHARGRSLPDIGRRLGGRDHSTVISGIRAFHACALRDADIAAAWNKWRVLSVACTNVQPAASMPAGDESGPATNHTTSPGGYVLTADSGGCCEVAAPEGTSADRPGGHVCCANAAKHCTHSSHGEES